MSFNDILKVIEESLKDFTRNLKLIVPGIFLWIFVFLFSKFSYTINKTFVKTSSLIIWLILFSIISLSVFSFTFSGMIGASKNIIEKNKKYSFKKFFRNAKKYWFKNLIVLLIITFVGSLIWAIAFYGSKLIGESFRLDVKLALILYILIYFILIISFLTFLTFSIFLLVLKNLTIKESIKSSFKFVKKHYIETLSLNVLIFIIIGLFNKIKRPYFDVLEYVILIPLFILIFARLIISKGKNDI